MAKLARESKLREKRAAKQARKTARKLEAANPTPESDDALYAESDDALHAESDDARHDGLAESAHEDVEFSEAAATEPPSDA